MHSTLSPVRPHQVGQRLVSLTTPEANIRRKSSQRVSQKVMSSWRLTLHPQGMFMGAMRMARKPTSNSRLSLSKKERETERETVGLVYDILTVFHIIVCVAVIVLTCR